MLTSLLSHPAGYGWGPGPWFLLVPLVWFGLVVLVIALVGRRRRSWAGWEGRRDAGGARTVLAERYARGEIDETEYRARLEVLLASDGPRG